jgi:hypothetical protein
MTVRSSPESKELQARHEEGQAEDPDHDRSSCWCCCVDCPDPEPMGDTMTDECIIDPDMADEPGRVGTIIRVEYTNRQVRVATRGEEGWLVAGYTRPMAFARLIGALVESLTIVWEPPHIEEPEYDSIILRIGKHGTIEAFWHGIGGWYHTASAKSWTWDAVTDGATRIIVLVRGKQLVVDL